eukprot:TRINITY_DN8801_c0_g2_i1.p1 TRINITY_DN8801_c0_g2~~TRINITY_DN8801_c0_g2_i1.p1  ORF type:complete len:103 (+),score=21.40 TRINITY_DN8801_c0_g2_i1:91-399(+)
MNAYTPSSTPGGSPLPINGTQGLRGGGTDQPQITDGETAMYLATGFLSVALVMFFMMVYVVDYRFKGIRNNAKANGQVMNLYWQVDSSLLDIRQDKSAQDIH